jgi:hypothetical protein
MSHCDYTLRELHELTKMVGEIAVSHNKHDLALSALLGAYATVAMAHPCCLQECANQTFRLSMMLAAHAAAPQDGATSHVH